MNSNLTPRYFVIGVILTWAIYSLLPTYKYQKMTEPEKEELRTSGELYQIESRIIRQGLDLRGGMYMVLEADIPTLISNLADIRDDQLMEVIQTSKEKSSSSEIDFFDEFKRNSKISNLKLARYYHQYGASQNEIFDDNDVVYAFSTNDKLNENINPDYIRLINAQGEWRLSPLSENLTEVSYIWNGELRGEFPSWGLSKAWVRHGNEVLGSLRHKLEDINGK